MFIGYRNFRNCKWNSSWAFHFPYRWSAIPPISRIYLRERSLDEIGGKKYVQVRIFLMRFSTKPYRVTGKSSGCKGDSVEKTVTSKIPSDINVWGRPSRAAVPQERSLEIGTYVCTTTNIPWILTLDIRPSDEPAMTWNVPSLRVYLNFAPTRCNALQPSPRIHLNICFFFAQIADKLFMKRSTFSSAN